MPRTYDFSFEITIRVADDVSKIEAQRRALEALLAELPPPFDVPSRADTELHGSASQPVADAPWAPTGPGCTALV
jgi:hypothetical protein